MYFDEIYYARAGDEYLQHKDIFEFTHPPLTKLIITPSLRRLIARATRASAGAS